MEIRLATLDDAGGINRVYNWYVQNTAITFDIEDWGLEQRQQWISQFNQLNSNHHLVVGSMNGRVLGFAYNSAFRSRAAYASSTEVTIYIDHEMQGQGYGQLLYEQLFLHIGKTDLHRAYAVIGLPNPGSIRLHENWGFEYIGTLNEVGSKFNQYHDVAWLEKRLDP